MKKALSVCMSILLVLSLFAVPAVAQETEELKFAVASDLHYHAPREAIEGELDDPIFWYANRRAALEDESPYIIEQFLKQAAENGSDFVLIPGDLTNDGRPRPEDHYPVAEMLRAFEKETGIPVYVISGNHDTGAGENDTTNAMFKEIYAEFGYDEALTVTDEECSYTADLGETYRLIALDSCDTSKSTEDGMTPARVMWVLEQAKQAKEDGRYPILMMHHNLLDHLPMQRILSRNFIVKFHYSTAELFANAGIKLVFTGHEHCSDAAVYTGTLGNKIYDFATTSLTMYPLQFRMFTMNEQEITYTAETVDRIDTDALTAAVDGYTQEQIDLMNAGMNAYAKGFFKAGIEYRLALSLSMEKIGIAEGEFGYDLVNTAVGGLLKMLELPLYGEGSVSEIAAAYGMELPETAFYNGWDLVTELAGAHYEGSEAYSLDTPEVTLLLRMVSLILRDDLATVGDEVFFALANQILSHVGTDAVVQDLNKLASKVFGCVTPGQYFLVALVSPLLYQFAFDGDGVDDNNGSIEGYGTVNCESNTQNVLGKVQNFFATLVLYIGFFFKYITAPLTSMFA
ncbi:MAG: metallophosphoesterase [Clostridia bacterium]|nr:metallophosphoesterase [Clostridia bacterium]